MPVDFHIFPARNLVLARFTGHILLADCLASAQAYAAHPEANPMQNQLIDLGGVTGYERDFVKVMSTMAQLPDHLLRAGASPLVVYLAPTRLSQEITGMVLKSMAGIQGLPVSAVADEEHALEILGQPERSIEALLTKA